MPGDPPAALPGDLPGDPPAALPGWAASARYLALTTFRRNGAAVTTPVWFAVDGDRLVLWTGAGTGKVRRLRANPAVTMAPCSARGKPAGPAADGIARLLPGSDAQLVQSALVAKYGMAKRVLDLYNGVARKNPPPSRGACRLHRGPAGASLGRGLTATEAARALRNGGSPGSGASGRGAAGGRHSAR